MNVIQWKSRAVIALGVLWFLFLLYFLIPRKSYKPKFRLKSKVRHPLSHYLRQAAYNDTLLKLVLDQEFQHENSAKAVRRYLRPLITPGDPLQVSHHPEPQDFNIDTDVIVYIQIQKVTDRIFNKHLIDNLDKGFGCGCTKDVVMNPCHCKNNKGHIWLFSWFTVGWPCELHADWTMLHDCVDKELNKLEKPRKRRYKN